jgi:hypothetical protein
MARRAVSTNQVKLGEIEKLSHYSGFAPLEKEGVVWMIGEPTQR